MFFLTCFSVAVVLLGGTTVRRPKHVAKVYLVQLLDGTWTCADALEITRELAAICEWEALSNVPPSKVRIFPKRRR